MNIHNLIPGGCHTYSKGDDQYPYNGPSILSHGKGCYIWDINNNKYLDYGMGLRSVTVGYANDIINAAAIEEMNKGNNLSRASFTEYKAAEKIIETIPCAEMVKFAKNGSNVTTAAIKLARAYTDKKYVAYCKSHPFYSFDDWFIGTTPIKKGIPEEYYMYSVEFYYNDIESIKQLFKKYDLAAVIMEPYTNELPIIKNNKNFLQIVKKLCEKYNTVFILDEMITGFRIDLQGASNYFNVKPDLATFGKAMANGFSVAALVGKKEIMNLGNINNIGEERTFLLSSTHGAEMCSLGAFIKTVEFYKENKVIDHIWNYGKELINGVNDIIDELEINDYFKMNGLGCLPLYSTYDKDKNISSEMRTIFLQEMAKYHISIPYISISYSHKEKELNCTLDAIKKSLIVYKDALENKYPISNIIKPVFRQFN